jgi:hypothetical protein
LDVEAVQKLTMTDSKANSQRNDLSDRPRIDDRHLSEVN